jgi:hypothetical protein
MRQLIEESRLFRLEGSIVMGAAGQPKANPRHKVETMLAAQALS